MKRSRPSTVQIVKTSLLEKSDPFMINVVVDCATQEGNNAKGVETGASSIAAIV